MECMCETKFQINEYCRSNLHKTGPLKGMNNNVDATQQRNVGFLVLGQKISGGFECCGPQRYQVSSRWSIFLKERQEIGILLLVYR